MCCVRFSSDGEYLATGCNRTAQVFNIKTGAKIWSVTRSRCLDLSKSTYSTLTHGQAGDLYIRSVCFSPDGKLLATGAEDKKIRVCIISLCHKRKLKVGSRRSGTSQRKGIPACSTDTNMRFIH